jgi:biotin carboxylase
MEARIRSDFNIEGVKTDTVDDIKRKSHMKRFFSKAGVRNIAFVDQVTLEKARKFIKKAGYPVIIKPDKGSGANLTFKISNEEELRHFFDTAPQDVDFIAEEFVEGVIVTYDGLVDRQGNILLESSTVCEDSIMEAVNTDDHVHYVNLMNVPEDVKETGRNIIRSFNIRERFFHLELFRSKKDGEIVALELNMRPPGAWMTDAINFSYDIDIYREWANMVANGRVDGPFTGKYYSAYASRKHRKHYRHDHEAILQAMNGKLVKHAAIEPVFSRAMGNYAYQFRSQSLEEIDQYIRFIQEEARA